MGVKVRRYAETDRLAVHEVHAQAFGHDEGPEIVTLVDAMHRDPSAQPQLSLVAVDEEQVVGHVVFTPVRIERTELPVEAMILAPLGVLPSHQRQGVGNRLIHDGLTRLSAMGVGLVFVLGHVEYYRRCGFMSAAAYGLTTPHRIPEAHLDAWMVQELVPGELKRVRGRVDCCDSLNRPEYW